jgi:hypothetical protein
MPWAGRHLGQMMAKSKSRARNQQAGIRSDFEQGLRMKLGKDLRAEVGVEGGAAAYASEAEFVRMVAQGF